MNYTINYERAAALLALHYPDWDIEIFEEIDSTNLEVRRRVESGRAERPMLLLTRFQTSGRGRGARKWVTPPGTAFMGSAAMPLGRLGRVNAGFGRARPDFPMTLWPLQIGLALAFRLRPAGWHVNLKWPNDLIIRDKKFCGILCESFHGWFAAGVGMNVFQEGSDFPNDLPYKRQPTSLLIESGDPQITFANTDIALIAAHTLISVLESPWSPDLIQKTYTRWCETMGRKIRFQTGAGETATGIAREIDERGALIVETGQGERIAVAGEVEEVGE